MEQTRLTDEQIKRTENFLLGYKRNKLMLHIEKYEQTTYDEYGELCREDSVDVTNGLIDARIEMHKVRHFIVGLPNSEEKLLLYFHYVKGETVENCAELIGVSRRSVFRLRHKALALAYGELVRQRLIKPLDIQASACAC